MVDQANKVFVDQSETPIATIGSNYLQNFLSGGDVGKGIGILTSKRFYFKGQNFSGVGKDVKKTTEEGVVSIEDISYTNLVHTQLSGFLIMGVFLLALSALFVLAGMVGLIYYGNAFTVAKFLPIPAILFLVAYFVKRQTIFSISFPGGSFGFDIRYYPIDDIRDFQRQLHLMKDHLKENG